MKNLWITSLTALSLMVSQVYADNPNSREIAAFDIESVIAAKTPVVAATVAAMPGSGSQDSREAAQTSNRKIGIFVVLVAGLLAGGIVALTSRHNGSSQSRSHNH